MSLRTGAASAISTRLARSMLVSLLSAAQLGVGLQLLDDVDDALFLAGVELGHGLGDGRRRGQQGHHFVDAQQVAQVVHRRHVGRVADGDGQHLVLEGQRQDLVDVGHRLGHQRQRLRLRLDFLEVGDLEAVLFGQGLEQLVLVDEALRHGRLPGRHAGVLGLVEDVPELVVVDEAEVDEHLAELALAAARGAVGPFLLRGGLLGGRPSGGGRLRLGRGRRRWSAWPGAAPGLTFAGLGAGGRAAGVCAGWRACRRLGAGGRLVAAAGGRLGAAAPAGGRLAAGPGRPWPAGPREQVSSPGRSRSASP